MLESKKHRWLVLLLCCFSSLCIGIEVTTIQSIDNERNKYFAVPNASVFTDLVTEISNSGFPNANVSPEISNGSDLPFTTTSTTTESSADISTTSRASGTIPSNNLITATIQPTTSDVLEKWLHFENITKIFAKDTVKSLMPSLMSGTSKMNISGSCRRDMLKFLVGFRNIKTWAFSFIDASGKIIDGMLSGTLASLGDYDQCLNIKVKNDRKGKNFGQILFTGQYCSLDIKPPMPTKPWFYKLNGVVEELKDFAAGDNIINEAAKSAQFFHFIAMRIGLCVPSGCKASDIQQLVDIPANRIKWSAKVKRCEVKEENEYTPLIIGVMSAMSFFGFLLCLGSLIELYHKYLQKKNKNPCLEILTCFSIVSNFKRLINTQSANESMNCLHGIRFLSISWIVLAHTYFYMDYSLARGLRNAMIFQKDFAFQAVVNASVAVDTFFFISGFLVCYVTVKIVKENAVPFNAFLYIIHRLFRLLPIYILVIAFMYLLPILGSGPIFRDTLSDSIQACYSNWWTNILFVNNFINLDEMCLPHTWYVSCDMQLYIAALLVIVPILKWPWIGLSIASLGISASIVITMAITYIYDYPPTMLFVHPDPEQRMDYWANVYFKPFSHAGPYCMGLIMGYVFVTHPKLKFSKTVRVVGWLAAVAVNMAVLYGVYEWNVGRDITLVETLLYSGLHRVAWTYGVAWIVINCVTGHGGILNYILSWKFWIPLGRLTYAIYLIHPIVQRTSLANIRIRLQISHFFAVWIFFGHLMVTIGSAFVACMLVEAPFIRLEKIVLRAFVKDPRSPNGRRASIPNESTIPKDVNSEEQINGHVSHL